MSYFKGLGYETFLRAGSAKRPLSEREIIEQEAMLAKLDAQSPARTLPNLNERLAAIVKDAGEILAAAKLKSRLVR
jgi:hypothetical protein